MKNNINKYVSIIALMVVSLTFTSCLEEEVDFGEDASKVVAEIFDFNGPTNSSVQQSETYSVTSRGGSEFIWTVNGGEVTPIGEGTSTISVYYAEMGNATVSVHEKTASGQESATSTINVSVFGLPCNWTLITHDTYGDGWNGGYIQVNVNGIMSTYAQPAGADVEHTISIPNGAPFSIAYVSGGGTGGSPGWESENYFKLTAPDGTTMWEEGSFDYSSIPTNGVVTEGTNVCP